MSTRGPTDPTSYRDAHSFGFQYILGVVSGSEEYRDLPPGTSHANDSGVPTRNRLLTTENSLLKFHKCGTGGEKFLVTLIELK